MHREHEVDLLDRGLEGRRGEDLEVHVIERVRRRHACLRADVDDLAVVVRRPLEGGDRELPERRGAGEHARPVLDRAAADRHREPHERALDPRIEQHRLAVEGRSGAGEAPLGPERLQRVEVGDAVTGGVGIRVADIADAVAVAIGLGAVADVRAAVARIVDAIAVLVMPGGRARGPVGGVDHDRIDRLLARREAEPAAADQQDRRSDEPPPHPGSVRHLPHLQSLRIWMT